MVRRADGSFPGVSHHNVGPQAKPPTAKEAKLAHKQLKQLGSGHEKAPELLQTLKDRVSYLKEKGRKGREFRLLESVVGKKSDDVKMGTLRRQTSRRPAIQKLQPSKELQAGRPIQMTQTGAYSMPDSKGQDARDAQRTSFFVKDGTTFNGRDHKPASEALKKGLEFAKGALEGHFDANEIEPLAKQILAVCSQNTLNELCTECEKLGLAFNPPHALMVSGEKYEPVVTVSKGKISVEFKVSDWKINGWPEGAAPAQAPIGSFSASVTVEFAEGEWSWAEGSSYSAQLDQAIPGE